CQTNLKRHQWIYVLGLAIKCYPPVPPPSFIPKVTVKDDEGNHVSSWDTTKSVNIYNNEDVIQADDDDDDDDDDEMSLPPGVIYVSTLPDDLSNVEGDHETSEDRERILNSINQENKVVKQRSKSQLLPRSNKLHLPKPSPLSKSVSKSTGSLKDESQTHQHSFLPSSSWLEERPVTSPFSSTFQRPPLTHRAINSSTNLKFSRHMTNSAPDVKQLAAVENITK
ncbi:hypothetical protein QZH41_008285, partial [Actinostola sp. cb2023]